MNSPARWLALACCVLLAGCAGMGVPRSITLGEAELQAQLARRFPMQRSLLDTFELQLSDPTLRLDAPARRLATELTLRGSDRRSGRSLQGRLALDYGLRFEPADASIRLVQPRIESLQFEPEPGLSPRRSEMAQRVGIALAERLLEDLVLYRVPPERLERLKAAGFRPGTLQVTPAGVEITIEPVATSAVNGASR
jgi:hypothetical protein